MILHTKIHMQNNATTYDLVQFDGKNVQDCGVSEATIARWSAALYEYKKVQKEMQQIFALALDGYTSDIAMGRVDGQGQKVLVCNGCDKAYPLKPSEQPWMKIGMKVGHHCDCHCDNGTIKWSSRTKDGRGCYGDPEQHQFDGRRMG